MRREALQIISIIGVAVWMINLGYGFEGSLQPLGEYQFVSRTLRGPDESAEDLTHEVGNRFAASRLGSIPMPLPMNYLVGIDLQKRDFEEKMWSYLNGEWRFGGWWYYYLYALAIKEPLGTWLLVALAVGVTVSDMRKRRPAPPSPLPEGHGSIASAAGFVPQIDETVSSHLAPPPEGDGSMLLPPAHRAKGEKKCFPASWRDELVLLAPAVAVLVLVSSQTGFNHHVRYVLPAIPFLFIWASKAARSLELRQWKIASVAGAALTWSVVSSLSVFPHSLSYFNELAGGPLGGHYHLGNSNTDWGQDLFYLKQWIDMHPEARPLKLAYDMPFVNPNTVGIDDIGKPPVDGPQPGWHAVSVNQIHRREGDYLYFLQFQPVGMAGYSIYIYHITPEEAERVRQKLGLPPLAEIRKDG